MAKNKISVSFSKDSLDLYTLVKGKENGSSYICDLIRSDLETSNEGFEFKVEQILNKLLKDKQLIFDGLDKLPENNNNKATDEEVDMILNLF